MLDNQDHLVALFLHGLHTDLDTRILLATVLYKSLPYSFVPRLSPIHYKNIKVILTSMWLSLKAIELSFYCGYIVIVPSRMSGNHQSHQ